MKLKFLAIFSSVVIYQNVYAQSDLIFFNGFELLPRLNDTGIIWSAEPLLGNNIDCDSTTIAAPQDCAQGRDFTFNDPTDGQAGFSFTKLDANGTPLVDQSVDYATTPWACVKDNVTDLVWEVKNEIINSIHNRDNTYRWGGVTRQGNLGDEFYNDWDSLVNGSNNETLCGFNDWRVASTQELMSIANNGRISPAIDTDYFPNTFSSPYWTATPLAKNPNGAWFVLFFNGQSSTRTNRSTESYVRLVRSAH